MCDQGLGTSGSGQQFFYHRGRRYGHVLDPRSGSPAEGVLSATVLAPCGAEADALATTFFVMGVLVIQRAKVILNVYFTYVSTPGVLTDAWILHLKQKDLFIKYCMLS